MYAEDPLSDELTGSSLPEPPTPPGGAVRFTLLGPLEIRRNGVDHAPTTPKVLQLLGMLVRRPGRVVHIDSIVRELWADNPPRSVRTTMHTYVYQLRRCIEENQLAPFGEPMLVTKAPGYVLRISPEQVDVFEFQALQRRGRELLDHGRFAEAARCFRAALDLWSGSPLGNVQCGQVLSAYVLELTEERRSTLHLRIEAEIGAGAHHELIGELRSLISRNPMDEALHSQLMRVLGRSGRRSDALAAYRQLRARLNGELGVEPCDELQVLHRNLLCEGDRAA
ncbi:AfsR/SARP family transcriptional regulator [Saccharothrix hoggarensis]|uniref:BTAD domain-containing putative transcriptional regulator n=1 Tax=Saccharothrix hoggarensis TaxID=913853 RepID=A0ABW3R1Y7_9PSEU